MARSLRRMRKEPRALSPSSCSVCLGRGRAISWHLCGYGSRSSLTWTSLGGPAGHVLGCQTPSLYRGLPQTLGGSAVCLGSVEQHKT